MSLVADYIAESAVWAVTGFAAGFILGRVARDAYRASSRADPPVETGAPVSTHASGKRRWRPTTQWVLGIIVILLAIVTVVQGIVESAATRHVVDCQQEYSNAFADALDARTVSSGQAQDALDTLVTTVGHALSEPPTAQRAADVQKAITAYLASRAALKTEQQQHPYPPAPRDLCN